MDMIGANGPAGAGELVKDGSDQGFMADVIEPSKEVPVLVDFWAPWCGPCKTLGPIIERAVTAKAGKVKLVKINIDEHPGIAGQLGVRSIPAVFAFRGGQPVDGFMGALPEGQINQFIEKLLAGTDNGKAVAEALEQADAMLAAEDIGGAGQLYATVLQHEQDNVRAMAGLARCYLAGGDLEHAREMLDMAPEDKRTDPAWVSANKAVEMMANAPAPDEFAAAIERVEAAPDDYDARFDLAGKLAAAGRNKQAVEQLFAILTADLGWQDGKARARLLEIFEAAGPKDPVTVEGRRRLSSLLFS